MVENTWRFGFDIAGNPTPLLRPAPATPAWVDRIRQQLERDSRQEYRRLLRLEELRAYLETHLGATITDCARGLGWNYRTTREYTAMIRNEWKHK